MDLILEILVPYTKVSSGSRDVRVARELLRNVDRHAGTKKLGDERVAQAMEREAKARRTSDTCVDSAQRRHTHPLPSSLHRREEARAFDLAFDPLS